MGTKTRKILIHSLSKIIDMLLFTMYVVTCTPKSKFEVSDAEGPSSCVAPFCVLRRKMFNAEYFNLHIAINGTLKNINYEYVRIILVILSILYS
jgi:hypothetical protein